MTSTPNLQPVSQILLRRNVPEADMGPMAFSLSSLRQDPTGAADDLGPKQPSPKQNCARRPRKTRSQTATNNPTIDSTPAAAPGSIRPLPDHSVQLSRSSESFLAPALRTDTPTPESPRKIANDPLLGGCRRKNSATPRSQIGQNQYEVESLLDKWRGWFFVNWSSGSCTWEPKENILDDDLIADLEKRHEGLELGVEIVGTRRQGRTVKYRAHFRGRPKKEDKWVLGSDLSRTLIEKHRPPMRKRKKMKLK